ncbi:MAG: hypothetical protein ACM3OO_14420 [Planctomycetaceae bacterium]
MKSSTICTIALFEIATKPGFVGAPLLACRPVKVPSHRVRR